VLGNEIGISLLRSPVYPDPLADEGIQSFTYSLLPHARSWQEAGVLAEANDLNQPLLVSQITTAGPFELRPLSVHGMPLGLGCLKRREDGEGLIFRVYEPFGGRGDADVVVPAGWRVGGEVNLLEDPVGPFDGSLTPFAVRSWWLRPG
jgi:alpha-mannosidase